MSESLSCGTFTHPLVLAQHIASGTFTLVRANDVNTAEGTQERILGALIDVWMRNRRQQVSRSTGASGASLQKSLKSYLILV